MSEELRRREYVLKLETGVELAVLEKIPLAGRLRKALLLVHGSGVGSACWDIPVGGYSVMDYLALEGLDVYAVECRGYGRSSRPDGLEVNAGSMADDICALLPLLAEKSGVERLGLAGHSSGGTVTLLAADRCPELVSRLVLIGTPYKEINPQFTAYARMVVEMAREPGRDYVPNLHHKDIEQRLGVHEPETVEWYKRTVEERYGLIPGGLFPDLITNPGLAVVPRLDVPTLVIYGSHEYVVEAGDMAGLFGELKTEDKALIVIPGGFHLMFLEKYGHLGLREAISYWVKKETPGVG